MKEPPNQDLGAQGLSSYTDHQQPKLVDINQSEYGLEAESSGRSVADVIFQPSEFGILDKYTVVKSIYATQLSPTVVTLTVDTETNMVSLSNLWASSIGQFES
jgi:hypothetical protein